MAERELRGSCLCGGVSYSIVADPRRFYFCHCEQCRKITGSAHASNILCRPADINWESGADLVRRYDYPGRSFTRVFCSNCGSGLPFLNQAGSTLFIPAGSLDADPEISPGYNIFWGDRAHWYEAGTGAEHCEGFPP